MIPSLCLAGIFREPLTRANYFFPCSFLRRTEFIPYNGVVYGMNSVLLVHMTGKK